MNLYQVTPVGPVEPSMKMSVYSTPRPRPSNCGPQSTGLVALMAGIRPVCSGRYAGSSTVPSVGWACAAVGAMSTRANAYMLAKRSADVAKRRALGAEGLELRAVAQKASPMR